MWRQLSNHASVVAKDTCLVSIMADILVSLNPMSTNLGTNPNELF